MSSFVVLGVLGGKSLDRNINSIRAEDTAILDGEISTRHPRLPGRAGWHFMGNKYLKFRVAKRLTCFQERAGPEFPLWLLSSKFWNI